MIVLTPAELRGLDARALEELLGRSDCVVAIGEGELRGLAAAAFLFADYAVMLRGATVILDEPEAWAGAVWRVGRRAIALEETFTADAARNAGLADDVVDDAEVWRAQWLRNRSTLALDSAAALIRRRGGDALERAEFARLFAIGEPQRGLRAFLEKRSPDFLRE